MSSMIRITMWATCAALVAGPLFADDLNDILRSNMNSGQTVNSTPAPQAAPKPPQPVPQQVQASPAVPQAAQPAHGDDDQSFPSGPASVNGVATGDGNSARILTKAELRSVATSATAFIVMFAKNKKGELVAVATGSGVFLDPQTVLTNSHVADAGEALLVSVGGRQYEEATVASDTFVKQTNGADFALLRLKEPLGKVSLPIGEPVMTLTSVYSAGFPGTVVDNDQKRNALLMGDMSAVPEVVISSGAIQNVFVMANGVEAVTHSALISQGNSGGPLLNACGQIVGINTWTATQAASLYAGDKQLVDKKGNGPVAMVNSGFGMAQSVLEITRFLKSRHQDFEIGPKCPE